MKSRACSPGSRVGPLIVGALAVCLATIFVVARADAVGIDGFIGAGTTYGSDPGIRLTPGHGYDGQFYYRLALSPLSTEDQVGGIEFDAPAYRQQRVGYPVMAWTLHSVSAVSAPAALIAVNIAAIGFMTYLGARIADVFGRHPAWGLVLLAWPAFLFSLAFDLAEITGAALVLAAVLAILKEHHQTAVIALTAGVLVRETILILTAIALLTTRRWRYAIPLGVLALWQMVIVALWGTLPALGSQIDSERGQLDLPLRGLVEGLPHWSLVDAAVFASLVAACWAVMRDRLPHTFLRFGLGAYGLLALVLARPIWESWRGWARALTEFVLLLFVARLAVQRTDHLDPKVGPGATEPQPPASTPA